MSALNDSTPTPKASPFRVALLLLIVASLAIGVALRLIATATTVVDSPIRADAADYFFYAYNLTTAGTYSRSQASDESQITPDSVRSPGFPLFAAALLNPDSPEKSVKNTAWAQTGLSVAGLLLLTVVLWRLMSPTVALITSALVCISPHLINVNVYYLTESITATFLILAVLCLWRAIQSKMLSWWIVAGILFGILALIRPFIQYFPWLILAASLIRQSHIKPKQALVFVAIFLVTAGSWNVRNLITMGEFSDDTLSKNFLYHGSFPGFMHQNNAQSYGFPYRFDPNEAKVTENVEAVTSDIFHKFKTEPQTMLHWYLVGKPLALWSWNIIAGMGDAFIYPVIYSPYFDSPIFGTSHSIAKTLHIPVVIIALLTSILVWLPRAKSVLPPNIILIVRICSAVILYTTAIHMIGAPFPRYSIPLLPFIYTCFAVGILGVGRLLSVLVHQKPKELTL